MAGTLALPSSQSEISFIQAQDLSDDLRREEREALRKCLQQAKNGEGRVVIIAGTPGIGKTRTCPRSGRGGPTAGVRGACRQIPRTLFGSYPSSSCWRWRLARAPSPPDVREIFGEQAAEMSSLLPQLRRLSPDLPPPMEASTEQSVSSREKYVGGGNIQAQR